MNKNVTLNAICVFGNELLICSYAIGQGAVPTQDIVLIKLESPFTLNKHVKPACLPTKVYANWKFSCRLLNYRHSSFNAVLLYHSILSDAVFFRTKIALKFHLTRFLRKFLSKFFFFFSQKKIFFSVKKNFCLFFVFSSNFFLSFFSSVDFRIYIFAVISLLEMQFPLHES